jgi:hypothetical protein
MRIPVELEIEIETLDVNLGSHLLERKLLSKGICKIIGKDIVVVYQGTIQSLAEAVPDVIHIVVEIGKEIAIGIASGIISAWLYEKLKDQKVHKLKIEKTEVIVDQGEIKRILVDKMEQE